jgi:phospholipid/cholesterol/gamma-HCH transport system substrate-binding protein
MQDDSLYNNLSTTIANAAKISGRLERGEGTLGKLLSSDDQVYQDAQALVANLRLISQNLADGKGTLGKLLTSDDQVYADLQATLASVRKISESIENGEGTMGRLVQDPKLYDEASLLVEDIRAAVDDLREASPVTSFGSVIFGAF